MLGWVMEVLADGQRTSVLQGHSHASPQRHRGCRPCTTHAASFKYPVLYAMLHNIAPGLGTA